MAARLKWLKKNTTIIGYVFKIWLKKISDQLEVRRTCRRKMIAWRWHVISVKRRRNLFRLCFWPFFVWRRYVSKRAVGKEKAKFLVLRVLPTVLTMTVFRAWKVYAHHEAALNRCANKYLKKQMDNQVKYAYGWLRYWAWQRRVIRHAWIGRGLAMRRKVTFIRQNTPFQIWKAYAHYKRLVQTRLAAGGLSFKALFAPYSVPRYVFVCTFMYMYVFICFYTYLYAYIYLCMYMYIYVNMNIRVNIYMYTYVGHSTLNL
jgi:hypothetical protein